MPYDPFKRGPFPVGVRTAEALDQAREGRPLPTEVWYPATDTHRGQDLARETRDEYASAPGFPPNRQDAVRDAAPRPGRYPVIAFSHGFGGHRRQSTFLCTHLASHGFVVAGVDHTGNTMIDLVQATMEAMSGGEIPKPGDILQRFILLRPDDIAFMIDGLLDGSIGDMAQHADEQRIGMTGHSFGGWTTLAVTGRDARIRAAVPLAPAGGPTSLPDNSLEHSLSLDWQREVPSLFLVAERDSLLPLSGMHALLARTPSPKRMAVLTNADHMHFCDRADVLHEWVRTLPLPPALQSLLSLLRSIPPMSELCPAEHGYRFVRGLTLAHMDAVLKENEAASKWLAGDLTATLKDIGVCVETVD